jgi:predicted RNA-binding protein with PUA-like domain
MAYWLFKSEPETWSWEMQKKRGAKGEPWSGVRNHQAKLNMMAMKKGERGFFYHSGAAREIVGIVEVIGNFRPDPSDETGKFGLVDVKAVADLPKPVTLAQAKADPLLAKMTLVTFSRLSVQPVTDEEWRHVCKLAGLRERY